MMNPPSKWRATKTREMMDDAFQSIINSMSAVRHFTGAAMLVIDYPFFSYNKVVKLAGRHDRTRGFNAYSVTKKAVQGAIIPQIKECTALAQIESMGRVFVVFRWRCGTRNGDPDNRSANKKFVLDSLVKLKVIPTDSPMGIDGFSDFFVYGQRVEGVDVMLIPKPEED